LAINNICLIIVPFIQTFLYPKLRLIYRIELKQKLKTIVLLAIYDKSEIESLPDFLLKKILLSLKDEMLS